MNLKELEEEEEVEEGEVDVETSLEGSLVRKVEEEVDLVEKWLSLEIDTYQHLGKDKI
mgnify:CR=1 FL=1